MANPIWPTGLPSPIVSGNNYAPSGENVLRTSFPGGMKMRRRQTGAPEIVQFSLICTRAQVQILDNFMVVTLAEVGAFQWVEFRDPALGPADYQFRGRPKYSPVQVGRLWQADVELDLLTPFSGTFNLGAAAGVIVTNDGKGLTS